LWKFSICFLSPSKRKALVLPKVWVVIVIWFFIWSILLSGLVFVKGYFVSVVEYFWLISSIFWAWASRVATAWAEAALRSWAALSRLAISCSYLLNFFFMLLIYHTYTICQAVEGILLHLNFIDYQQLTENRKKNLRIYPPFLKNENEKIF